MISADFSLHPLPASCRCPLHSQAEILASPADSHTFQAVEWVKDELYNPSIWCLGCESCWWASWWCSSLGRHSPNFMVFEICLLLRWPWLHVLPQVGRDGRLFPTRSWREINWGTSLETSIDYWIILEDYGLGFHSLGFLCAAMSPPGEANSSGRGPTTPRWIDAWILCFGA